LCRQQADGQASRVDSQLTIAGPAAFVLRLLRGLDGFRLFLASFSPFFSQALPRFLSSAFFRVFILPGESGGGVAGLSAERFFATVLCGRSGG